MKQNDWTKQFETLMKEHDIEAVRCGGSFKYNRKSLVKFISKLLDQRDKVKNDT